MRADRAMDPSLLFDHDPDEVHRSWDERSTWRFYDAATRFDADSENGGGIAGLEGMRSYGGRSAEYLSTEPGHRPPTEARLTALIRAPTKQAFCYRAWTRTT